MSSDSHNFECIVTDYEHILETRKVIRELSEKIKKNLVTKKTREKMKYMRSQFDFERVFGSESVQGTAGIIKLKDVDNVPIVFKVSNGVDYAIEHESIMLDSLRNIETFCHHFMSKYNIIELPVPAIFFSEPHEEYGFMEESNDYFITNLLLTEYISRFTYYHYIMTNNIPVVNSLILQIMAGFRIAQDHVNFTHYDMHLDNTLVRSCDKNTIHIYKFSDKPNDMILVPTFGNVPVVIDMGSSYSKDSKSLITSIEHYENGLQSCVYDKFNDLHHFLFCTLSCLCENEVDFYKNVFYKLLCMFSMVPMWKDKGWKILEHDIVDKIFDYLLENCEFAKERSRRHLYKDYFDDIIETINGCIDLPFKNVSMEEIDEKLPAYWDRLFLELEKIIESEDVSNDTECVYVIKEIVVCAMKIKAGENEGKSIQEMKNRISTILSSSDMKNINFKEIISVLKEMGVYLGSFYNRYVGDHLKTINDGYDLMKEMFKINDLNDVMRYLKQILPCDLEFNQDERYVVYIFDSFDKKYKKKEVFLKNRDIDRVNNMSNIEKCRYFIEIDDC